MTPRNGPRTRRCALLAALLLGLAAAPAGAAAPSPEEAHLYPRGAQAVFRIPVTGETTLEIPGTFDPATLEVSVEGTSLLGLETQPVRRGGWVPPSASELAARIGALSGRLTGVEARLAAKLQSRRDYESCRPATARELAARLASREAARTRLETEIRALEGQRDALGRDLRFLQDQLQAQLPPDPERFLQIRLRTSGRGTARVAGTVQDASWRPAYRASVDTATGKVRLEEFLEVRQKSGLDWKGTLVCHTASPADRHGLPDLNPWVVDLARPERLDRGMAKMALYAGGAPAPEANFALSETDLSFRTQGLVPGTGNPVQLAGGTFDLAGNVEVRAVPVLDREAWMTVRTSPLPRPLLGGETSLSVNGLPTGKASLPPTAKGEELTLPFGRVPGVTADRREEIPRTSRSGGTWTWTGGYSLRVRNSLDKPMDVTVEDRIPRSATDRIRVEATSSPKPDDTDGRTGVVTWKLRLAPGEERVLKMELLLRHPENTELAFR